MCHFLPEVKKFHGSDFPPQALYDILICLQFFLETFDFQWKLLDQEQFSEVKFILNN